MFFLYASFHTILLRLPFPNINIYKHKLRGTKHKHEQHTTTNWRVRYPLNKLITCPSTNWGTKNITHKKEKQKKKKKQLPLQIQGCTEVYLESMENATFVSFAKTCWSKISKIDVDSFKQNLGINISLLYHFLARKIVTLPPRYIVGNKWRRTNML